MSNQNTFAASFTDIYGVKHEAAICMIASVSRNASFTYDEAGSSQSQVDACNYQVRYWHSAEAKASGARHQEYVTKNSMGSFSVQVNGSFDPEEIRAKCQSDFLTNVLAPAA